MVSKRTVTENNKNVLHCFKIFWQEIFVVLNKTLNPKKFACASEKGWKEPIQWVFLKGFFFGGGRQCFRGSVHCWKSFKKIINRKKCKMIGGQAEGPLNATTIYRAMIKKNLKQDKWPKWQMIKDVTCKKIAKKCHNKLFRPKTELFRSR